MPGGDAFSYALLVPPPSTPGVAQESPVAEPAAKGR